MEIPGIMKMIAVSALRILVAVYIGLCILLYFQQAGMVYHPSRQITLTPAELNLAYEDVSFETSDGERIAAWFVPAEDARGTLLMCHGNGGNIGDRVYAIDFFRKLGMNVFIFDYRGYGMSSGKPSEEGTYFDAMAAWRHLVEERSIAPGQIVIHGRSLGGAVAAWLATQADSAGLVLESTFTSIPDVGKKMYPYLPIRLLSRFQYDTFGRIGDVRCPILIVHSKQDEMIAFEHGRKIFSAAPEPKWFLDTTGSHNDGESFFPEAFRNKLEEFFGSVLGNRSD